MAWERITYRGTRRLANQRLWPLSDDFSGDPFFIIGAGRSGMSILRRMLTAHPRLFVPPVFAHTAEVVQDFQHRAYREWPRLVAGVLDWYEWQRSWQPLLSPIRGRVQAELEAQPPQRRSLARIIESIYTAVGAQCGKAGCAWGDGSPVHTGMLRETLELFPRARVIHVLRDGVDVVASFLHHEKSPDLPHYAARWQTAARLGRGIVEAMPQQSVELRYEALVTTPLRTLEPACDLLSVAYEPAMLDAFANEPLTDTGIGKGRRELRPDQLARLQQLIGDDLRAFGYDVAL